ncbi:MAG TPA: hypothetical protein VK666_01910 [Chryseolinea sp.]|nr:hypothetical protein [Chryseolinea sp.]
MEELDDLKKRWATGIQAPAVVDSPTMEKVVKQRVSKHTRIAIKYFWASFTLQIIVYALLSHVIVKYWNDIYTLIPSVFGILIFVPFTKTLLSRFKSLAGNKIINSERSSVHDYVFRQRELLQQFFLFKRRYELMLIPLSCLVGALLTFKLYVPGGAYAHLTGLAITICISIASCYFAIRRENRIHFIEPIEELTKVLEEYQNAESEGNAKSEK